MFLGSDIIKQLILDEKIKLVTGYLDLDKQLQPNGFDMTVQSIVYPINSGIVFANSKRLPNYEELPLQRNQKGQDFWYLEPNQFYIAIANESTNLPSDITALFIQRSTLMREGTLTLGLGDVGYKGQWSCSLHVRNPYGMWLEKNSRIAQMVFIEVKGNPKMYNGNYQNETGTSTYGAKQ